MQKKINYPPFHLSFLSCLLLISGIFWIMADCIAEAANYVRYVDANITDTYSASANPDCTNYSASTGTCGSGSDSAYRTLRDVNAFINILGSSDTAFIYFKRGDTWTFTSDSDCIQIKKSNVTIDAYGSGDKPILDGAGTYPSTYLRYAISVSSTVEMVSNTTIRNLKLQNMYPGQGIIFNGADGNLCSGPALVEYVDAYLIGGNAIYIYGVINNGGSANAIKIEHCSANKCGETFRRGGTSLGTCAIGTFYNSRGHEIRYNTVWDICGEGINIPGVTICEYNMVSDTQSTDIYYDPGNFTAGQCIIRYNLVWNNPSGLYDGAEIKVDDEMYNGDNSGSDIQIYGNVIIGGYSGIDLRNNPYYVGTTPSKWGSIKVYNNTLIDNKHNIIVLYPDRFTGPVIIKNNASIIHSDAASVSTHIAVWNATIGSAFTIGPNFFYGDSTTSNSNLITAFQHASNVFGTVAPLPKTSGWRSLTSLNSFSFSDISPASNSELVGNSKAEVISGYDRYLTNGSDFETLPSGANFVLATQNVNDTGWDFGAIIRQNILPLLPPDGVKLIK